MEQFLAAVKKEIARQTDGIAENIKNLLFFDSPLLDVYMDMPVTNGGKYNNFGIHGVGVTNAADCLVAIKRYVFDEKSITKRKLIEAVDNDFNGYADKKVFEEAVLALDEIIMDIKLFEESEHIQYTGVSNRIIKENFLFLKNSGKPFLIRTPLIEGKTDSKENLRKIKEFIGDVKWERLPENKLGLAKKEMLNV